MDEDKLNYSISEEPRSVVVTLSGTLNSSSIHVLQACTSELRDNKKFVKVRVRGGKVAPAFFSFSENGSDLSCTREVPMMRVHGVTRSCL